MMQHALSFKNQGEVAPVISPHLEMGAYEVLWSKPKATFKTIADQFRSNANALPSDLVPPPEALKMANVILDLLAKEGVKRFGVRVHRAGEYPPKLRDARHPVELLYFQGWWNLVETPSVAVVGTRHPSPEGVSRTEKIVRKLVEDGRTIVSGLAAGIDTAAHTTGAHFVAAQDLLQARYPGADVVGIFVARRVPVISEPR